MQFRDLIKQYHILKNDIDDGIADVIEATNFINGKQVKQLEEELAKYVGVKHCITCANGTDALNMALMALKIGSGDAVFVPDFTFFASGEVVSYVGATPVFVDVDKDTFNLSADSLENAIKAVEFEGKLKAKVVISVDLFGLPADYSNIKKITKQYGLLLLEDGAQGFGGSINGKRACSFGDISTTSFFPAKPLGCYGDGGAIFTDDNRVAEYLHSVCVHGKGTHKYDNIRIGLNSRLDTIQAAILLPKFKAFQEYELDAVNRVAKQYMESLKGIIHTPSIPAGFYSSWAQYTILLDNRQERDGLQQFLEQQDIPSMVYYMKPMHMQKAFKAIKNYVNLDVTSSLCNRVLSLPIHPYLTEEEIERVIYAVTKFTCCTSFNHKNL